LFAGQDFLPNDPALRTVRLRHRSFEHPDRCAPDVRPGSIAFDVRNYGVVRHIEPAISPGRDTSATAHSKFPVGNSTRTTKLKASGKGLSNPHAFHLSLPLGVEREAARGRRWAGRADASSVFSRAKTAASGSSGTRIGWL